MLISGVEAKGLLSTAWLFKIVSHRMLSLAMKAPLYTINIKNVDSKETTHSKNMTK